MYGNERYVHQYISEEYPENEINFDLNKIKLITIDIEVAAESGFPDVFNVAEELLLITIQDYATKELLHLDQDHMYKIHNERITSILTATVKKD